jgi:hypothetical protein
MHACIFLCKILIKTIAPQDFRFFATSGFEFNCITFYVGSLTKANVNARKNVGSTPVFLLSKPFLLLKNTFCQLHTLFYIWKKPEANQSIIIGAVTLAKVFIHYI